MINSVQSNEFDATHKIHQIQERERKRIAQELHDEIGQYLTAIHLDASAITASEEIHSAHNFAADIDSAALQVMKHVKTMLQRLRPFNEQGHNFEIVIENLLNTWTKRNSDIVVSLNFKNDFVVLDEQIAKVLYRLIQESLTNVTRHANASHVSIDFVREQDKVYLSVKDDGKGFDMNSKSKGFGLMGMQERVAELNGHFELLTRPEVGVTISVSMPCP